MRRSLLHIPFLFVIAFLGVACGSAPEPKGPVLDGPETVAIERNRRATQKIYIDQLGHGSGVVIDESGLLLTNDHVACAGQGMAVWVYVQSKKDPNTLERVSKQAVMLHRSQELDLAVVKVDHRFTDVVMLRTKEPPYVGDRIYNIGYPLRFGEMFTRGYVMRDGYSSHSRFNDDITDNTLADLENGPGASGSGIFLERTGELVGIMRFMSFGLMGRGIIAMKPRGFVPMVQVSAFLDENNVPYLTGDGVRHNVPAPPEEAAPKGSDTSKPASEEMPPCPRRDTPFKPDGWGEEIHPLLQ